MKLFFVLKFFTHILHISTSSIYNREITEELFYLNSAREFSFKRLSCPENFANAKCYLHYKAKIRVGEAWKAWWTFILVISVKVCATCIHNDKNMYQLSDLRSLSKIGNRLRGHMKIILVSYNWARSPRNLSNNNVKIEKSEV